MEAPAVTIGISATIALVAFAGMVTSAYTADHIKRSSCDMTKDANLAKAYKWSWSVAVMTGVMSAGAVGIVGLLAWRMAKQP